MYVSKECRHIMPTGRRCQSPAMRGSAFCYFHGRPQRRAPARRPIENPINVSLVFEAESAQNACNEIVQGLAANRISNRRAALLLYGVQLAKAQSPDGPFPFEEFDFPDNPEDPAP